MSPFASNIACAPSGRNLRVLAGTVMEEIISILQQKSWEKAF